MKKIVFTGGGSAGHVTPNIAVIEELNKDDQWKVWYVGSKNGIEKDLVSKLNLTYKGIYTGKLRRYFSLQNFFDLFKTAGGIIQSYFFLRSIKPDIVFSKGGFVGFPVAVAAYLTRARLILHEADMTPGLANKLSFPFAKKIYLTFPETTKNLKPKDQKKAIVTGLPLRIFNAPIESNLSEPEILSFSTKKPILFVFGGSLGSVFINSIISELIDELLVTFNIIHVCGKDKSSARSNKEGYKQAGFLGSDFFSVLLHSDIIISRAGANSIMEILHLKKRALFIPLSANASRGDQILNAKYFCDKKTCEMMLEEDYTPTLFLHKIQNLIKNKNDFIKNLSDLQIPNANKEVGNLINELI